MTEHRLWKVIAIVAAGLLLAPSVPAVQTDSSEPASDTVQSVAEDVYNNPEVTAFNASDTAFEAAFGNNYDLYTVKNSSILGAGHHVMAYEPTDNVGFDTTRDLNKLLTDAAVLIGTADEAMKIGKAFAQIGNAEIQFDREVVDSSDSDRLNRSIDDPEVRQLLNGWEVRLETWSPENGVLMDWEINLATDRIRNSQAGVTGIGLGDHRTSLDTVLLENETRLRNDWGSGHSFEALAETDGGLKEMTLASDFRDADFDTIADCETFDSYWLAEYPKEEISNITQSTKDIGKASVQAGCHAYDLQVDQNPNTEDTIHSCSDQTNDHVNWGFSSLDRDCINEVRVTTPLSLVCMLCDAEFTVTNETRIYVNPAFPQYLKALGHYDSGTPGDTTDDPSVDSIMRAAMADVHVDVLADYESDVDPDDKHPGVVDGVGRLAQTLVAPNVTHRPDSQFYGDGEVIGDGSLKQHSGANEFLKDPSENFCDTFAGTSLYWGFLYDNYLAVRDDFSISDEPGMETVREVIDEIDPEISDCEHAVMDAVDHAVSNEDGEWLLFHETQTAFAEAVYRQNLTWGSDSHHTNGAERDWSKHLREVAQGSVTSGDSITISVGGIGYNYTQVDGSGDVTIDCQTEDSFNLQIFLKGSDGSITTRAHDCSDPTTVDLDAYEEVVFNSLYTFHASGQLTLTVD